MRRDCEKALLANTNHEMSTADTKQHATKTSDKPGVKVAEPNAKHIVVTINGASASGTSAKSNGKGSKGKEASKKKETDYMLGSQPMDLDMGESGSDSSDDESSEHGSGGDTRSPSPDVVAVSSDDAQSPGPSQSNDHSAGVKPGKKPRQFKRK